MSTYLIDYENTTTSGLKGIDKLSSSDKVVIFYGKNPSAISFQLHIQIAQSKASIEYIQLDKVGKNYLDFQLATYMGYLIATTKEQHYHIVSKDGGYESVIAFWKKKKSHLQIKRQQAIDETQLKVQASSVVTHNMQPASPTTVISLPPAPELTLDQLGVESEKTKQEIASTHQLPSSVASKVSHTRKELPESIKKKIRLKMKPENLKGGSYTKIYHLFLNAHTKQNLNIGLVKAFQHEKGNKFYKLLLPEFETFLNTHH